MHLSGGSTLGFRPVLKKGGFGILKQTRYLLAEKVHSITRFVHGRSNVNFGRPLFCVNICRANDNKQRIVEHLSIPTPPTSETATYITLTNRDHLLPHRISFTKLIASAHHRHYLVSPFYKCNPQYNKVKKLLPQNSTTTTPLTSGFHSLDNLHKSPMFLTKLVAKFMSTGVGSGAPIGKNDQDSALCKFNKRIKINACGELYAELSVQQPSLYSNAPKNRGINFEIDYYDSLELIEPIDNSSPPPTVCLLHGAPGHYKDFKHLIEYLESKGIRVIAPNFPAYSATFEHSFRHSPRERLDVLLKFFAAIQLYKIDLLIGHSSAVYTMFELLNRVLTEPKTNPPGLQINSLGLFNTPTYNLPPHMAVTPVRMLTLKLFDFAILRPIIVALIDVFAKIQGIQNRVDGKKIENLLIAASAVGYSESDNMAQYLKLVRSFKVPTFVLIGSKDKLIPMYCFEQLKRDLGILSEKQVRQYNHDGQLESDVSELDELVEVSQFASGGHYTFQKYAQQVNRDVYSFLTSKVLSPPKPVSSTKL